MESQVKRSNPNGVHNSVADNGCVITIAHLRSNAQLFIIQSDICECYYGSCVDTHCTLVNMDIGARVPADFQPLKSGSL